MRVACLQADLTKGLSIVRRAITSRSTLPILTNVLLATDQGRLKLSATNLELGINCWIEAQVEETGSITVPAQLLNDFVNSLPSERIDLTLNTETQTLNLQCAHFDALFKGIEAQEFPTVPSADDGLPTIQIAPHVLHSLIQQVCFAAATDEGHPVLTGVHALFGPDSLTLSATDIFRLARKTVPLDQPMDESFTVIIPARTLIELGRILGQQSSPIRIAVTPNRNQILFHLEQVDLVSQLLEGQFPDFSGVIPSEHTTRTVLHTPTFLNAARVSQLFSKDAANTVKIDISPQRSKLILTAVSQDLGENVSELQANVSGEGVEIAFNARFLIDVLSAMGSSEVALETTSSTSPGLIYPIDDQNLNYVICPMHISQ